MSSRYEAREAAPTGWGRKFYSERLSTVREIIDALGGQWRIRRQWKHGENDRWHKDGGRNDWFEGSSR